MSISANLPGIFPLPSLPVTRQSHAASDTMKHWPGLRVKLVLAIHRAMGSLGLDASGMRRNTWINRFRKSLICVYIYIHIICIVYIYIHRYIC